MGAASNDFGVPGVRDHAMFLESRMQADTFRKRLLNACLRANHAAREGTERTPVRIAIIGGGATGVELSAELYNAAKSLRTYGLEVFDDSLLEVCLIEAGPRLLAQIDDELAEKALEQLQSLGVQVKTGTQVTEITSGKVMTNSGDVDADLIVWAAGVKGDDSLATMSDLTLTRLNQFVTRPTLQTTQDDRIFAIGDCASCTLPGEERPVPPRAQAAHQMASAVFNSLCNLDKGKDPATFSYHDHGSLVSLSRFSALGDLMGNLVGGRMAIEGRLARLAYASLYRMHVLAVHGWWRGSILIVVGKINGVVRPRLKLH